MTFWKNLQFTTYSFWNKYVGCRYNVIHLKNIFKNLLHKKVRSDFDKKWMYKFPSKESSKNELKFKTSCGKTSE